MTTKSMTMTDLPRFTAQDVMSWQPCKEYDLDRIEGWYGDREYATALDVLEKMRGEIPDDHMLWLLLRPECIPKEILHDLACRYAEKVLPIWESKYPDDQRPRNAINAKCKWIRGEIADSELEDARLAARDAGWAAGENAVAAEITAEAAARAAEAAARAAARAAAWAAAAAAAAWDTAWDTARDAAAESAWQVDEIASILSSGAFGA